MNRNNQEEKKKSERQIYNSNRINFYSTPYFGPIYEDRNNNVIRNYHGVNSGEKRYQNYIPNNNHFYRPNYFNRKIYNSNHRAYYLGDFKNSFIDNKTFEERVKLENEKELENSIIDKIENAFFGQVSREEIFNIIRSLIIMPSLTIFEAMILIYRQVKIYQSLAYYKINKHKSISLDEDIYENKYPEEFSLTALNKIIEEYKVNKNERKNNNVDENSNFFYIDEKIDKRRTIHKNQDGIYNYLPIKDCNIFEQKNFENLEIFAKNENEINYHPLFYKTIMCNSCQIKKDNNNFLSNILCPYSHDIQNEFRIIYDYKDNSICELMNALSKSKLFNFQNYLNYIPKN